MAITAQLFDGTTLEFPDDTDKSVIQDTVKRITEEKQIKPDTGFTGAFKAGKERLKGDVAALAGRTGIMDTEAAEAYKAQKERLAEKMFTPTQEGWSEAPFTKFKETLGGSLPYTAAPLAAGIAAATLPVSAPVAAAVGAGGAGLASLAQFTGSNLSRQMQENPNMKLAETDLAAAGAAALPQAALDVISLRMIPGIGKIFGAAGKEITPAMAKQIAEQGMLKTAGSYALSGAKLSGVEGATEAGQQFFERLQAGLNIADEQARSEYFDNFIGGAVLGGTLSVPGTYIERGQTIRKGAQMEEEEKKQAIVDRQNAQREAYLAEQEKLKQTSENLGVSKTLALPAPTQKLEPIDEAVDPLLDPLGRFKSTDLSPKEVAEVNKRRKDMGKPRIGRTFSIEDLADVFKPDEATAAEGVLGRLIAARTNFTGEDIPAQSLELAAQQRGLDTRTQGFRDFLTRVTGSEDLNSMSPPQRFAVAQAIKDLKAGEESRILESGISNAKHYTPDQYNDALKGLSKEFREMGNQENGRSSVLSLIEKYSGLKNERDQQRILDEAVKNGDLERNIKESSTGNTIETFKPATAMTPLPGGMDIRKETFKQGEAPEAYEVRAGSRVISSVQTAEEADKNAAIFEQKRQEEIVNLEKQVRKLESEMAKRDAELANDQALGNDQSNEFFIKSANYYGQNQVANASIADLRQKQQTFAEPVRVEPIGMKAIPKDSFTFYEKDQPQVRFDTELDAEKYGISRLDDKTLRQIIDSAPVQKQTGRVKRYSDLAQKELNDRQSIEEERGIAVTTTKGLKGAKERLEDLGIYTKEVHDQLDTLRKTLLPALKRFGLEKVGLRIVNSIENGKADGMYVQQIMTIALDSKNPMGTLRHESIHALKELGAFTPQEWKVLENKAKSEWVQKYIKDANLYDAYKAQYQAEKGNLIGFEPYIQEEAIAEAFKQFKVGNLPAGMIGNIWSRLNKMFEALRNSFNKLGFQTTDDIFTKIEEGKVEPVEVSAPLEKGKFALRATQEERQNIIDKAEKIANTDQDTLENTRWSDLPEGPFAYQYYEAQKLLPKPSDKLKKLNYRISEALDNHYEWIANVDGEYFGVTKEEDPDYDPYGTKDDSFEEEGQAQKGKFNYVYSNLLDDLVSSELRRKSPEGKQTDHFDQKELFADIRKDMASEGGKYSLRKPDEIRKIGENLVGAPPNAKTEKDRTALVKRMTNILSHPFSMYGKSKDWYERSGDTIRDIAHGDEALMEKIVRLTALYSQANSLGGNITAVVKSMDQLARGEITARAGRFPETTAKVIPEILAAKNFDTDLKGVNDKLMNFYHNLHDGTFKTDTFEDSSTIDRWMMRLFGYPHSEDQEVGGLSSVSATQYKYAKDLVRRIADANEKNTGEKLLPRQIQAVLWTYIKNTTEYEKAKAEGKAAKFEPNSLDFSDYVNRATANITWESRPSTSIDLIPGIHSASREEQESFNRDVRKIFETAKGDNKIFELLNEGVLYSSQNSIGAYENQIAPNVVTRLVLSKDEKGHMTEVADKTAAIIGYVTKQDAVPWYRADPTASGKMASKGYKVIPTAEVTKEFEDKLFKHLDSVMPGVGFTRVDNSFDFINFRGEDGKPFFMSDKDYIAKLQNALETFSSDVTFNIDPFKTESAYIFNDWKENPNGEGYLERFNPRQLTDIQPTIDGWRKDYETLADKYGRDYGWAEATTPKYSLKGQIDPTIQSRIGATTTVRKEAGFVDRIIDAISPTAMTKLRQAFINKYDSIEKLSRIRGERMGGDQLLAENSAIAAALQSDRAAGVAASSFRDGVPVFDKGYTYVSDMDGKVKGLIPVLEPLMKYKDPYVFQAFQYYAGTRRGRRLDAEGREKVFTKEDIDAGKQLEAQFPEFATVFDEYQKYNQGLVKYMMDTGVISAQEAKSWTENWDYIPFYRQLDGDKTAGPKVFSPIAGVAKPKKLKGSEASLDDFMETVVRNARAAIEAGMKNEAARRVIRDVVDFGLGERLPSSQSGSDVVSVKENGQTVYYRVADPLLVESLKGLNLPQLPFMDFLSAPANLLRNFVTKDPGFILANLGRDSMQAWITSGTDMKPLVDSFKQFGKELMNQSPEAYALSKSGLTGYDFAGDVESTAKQVEKELRKRSGTRTKKEQALLPITAFWDMLEKGSHASDMATRAEVYKRTLERTGSEAEAFYQAMEVMNFSRKGNSALVRILSAMIPFFNARVQGLDVLYRTGFGKTAMENKEKIQKAFIFRSMILLGSSVMYWAMVSDDEDYKKLSKEERDNYWIIPALQVGDKPFRFPIPFELGVLFKVLPERALEYSFGTDTGKDLRESLIRNAVSTLSFNPIPQAALPLVENATNHSFFTGEPIIGRGVEGLSPQYQYTGSTSELAKKLGKELNYSPQKIENLIRGYTGTMGTYAMMMIDAAITGEGDSVKATKRVEQLPVIKRFFAGDSGTISAFYDLKEEVDTAVNTVNFLQRTGNTEDLKTFLEKNQKLYALKGYVGVLDKNMKQLSQTAKMINESKTMTSDEKREALDKLKDAQLKLTERVRLLRKNYE